MRNFRRILSFTAALMLLLTGVTAPVRQAKAERVWLIEDSNTRKLTKAELWQWNYEALGYILNEIFARHGYVFKAGGQYEYYFSCMPWYTPNSNPNNSQACYPQMNSTEWYNERLVKEVRQEMRSTGNYNLGGRSVWTNFSTGFNVLQGFEYVQMKAGQKLSVYSAPSASSWRGANGKAMINTNGAVYAAGYENGWLLVMYETNNGGVRVGYVDTAKVKGSLPGLKSLNYEYIWSRTISSVSLTDDPAKTYSIIMTLPAGTEVVYLSTYFNNTAWDYVQTRINGQDVRGFIPSGYLQLSMTEDSNDDDGWY